MVEKIKRHCSEKPEQADFVFTTTHKSKGLEWKTVVLLDDFIDLDSTQDFRDIGDADEMNLIYVALTRARENIVLNKNIIHLLALGGESFEEVISMKRAKILEHNIECLICHDNIIFEDNVLGLKSKCLKMRDGTVRVKAGHICSVCAAAAHFRDILSSAKTLAGKRVKSREFLRYFVGVLPDKYQEGLNRATIEPEPQMWAANVMEPVHIVVNGVPLLEEPNFWAAFYDSDEDEDVW